MELYEKLETAFAAYLKQFVDGDLTALPPNTDVPASFYWPPTLQNDDKSYRIFAGESAQDKNGQAILIIAEDADKQEEPQYTGNFYVPIQIWLRTPFSKLTDKEKASPAVVPPLDSHKAAATVLEHALMQDPFTLAANVQTLVPDLTIYAVLDRRPERQQTENFWASGWTFRVYAMSRSAP